MNLDTLRASLIKHEGVRNLPYEDSVGELTIGIGHLMARPISRAAIDQILTDDINDCIRDMDRSCYGWRNHDSARQNVLLEMCFNLGVSRLLGFKRMWAALQRKDYAEAAAEMLSSKWAEQVKGRAITLAEAMKYGK